MKSLGKDAKRSPAESPPSADKHAVRHGHKRSPAASPPTVDVHVVREEDKPSLRACWVVLARRRYDESLYEVGTVTADDPSLAELYARRIYDEHPWIEMVVIPRREIRTVIPS